MRTIRVHAFRRPVRLAAGVAQALALATLLELALRLFADVFASGEAERLPLPYLVRRMFFGTALPILAVLLARLLSRGKLEVDGDRAVLHAEGGRIEVSLSSRRPWRLPLPEPGFDVDGCAYGLAPCTPTPVWRHWALRLCLAPAAVTFILFRLHELIAYGGLFGEWHLLGPRRWLRTLTGVALYSFCTLFVCAAVLRVLVEVASLLRPSARRGAEAIAAIAWYAGIAAVLALRLL